MCRKSNAFHLTWWYFQLFPLLDKLPKRKRFPMSNISLSSPGFYKWEKKKSSELKKILDQKSQTPADQQEIWVLKVITPTHKHPHVERSEHTVGNGSYITHARAILNQQHLHWGWNIGSDTLYFCSFGVYSNITNSQVLL